MKSSKLTPDEKKQKWIKNVESQEMRRVIDFKNAGRLSDLYEIDKKESWILRTIDDKKIRYKLKESNYIIHVGSGMYPYSLMDMYKRFPHIKYIGLEIIPERAKVSQIVLNATPAKEGVEIKVEDGTKFDYSFLSDEDMVFIGSDVDTDAVFNQVLKTSGAQVYPCAPYKNIWLTRVM
jgi:tRNA G46 methylase TrmB